MLVKAKWSVKDASGWHDAGEVFETECDLKDAVEVLSAPKQPAAKTEAAKAEPAPETKAPEKAAEAPRSTSRRKKVT